MADYWVGLEGGVNSNVGGSLDSNISGEIGTKVTGEMKIIPAPMDVKVTGDPSKPVGSTVEVLNFPRLTLKDIKDIVTPTVRVHIPNYQQMSFKLLGFELFTWCLSGETQVISQPFVPNKFEECRIECPDEDTRPFPDGTPVHKKHR